MSVLTIESLTEAAEDAASLGAALSVRRKGELFYDAILYTLLMERHGRFVRQWQLPLLVGQRRPKRIDYKERHKAGAVIEFAVRSRTGAELLPTANCSELRKLLRARTARIRFLVLLDPTKRDPHDKTRLRRQYVDVSLGKGMYNRLPIRVIYARKGDSFHFVWRP